MTRSSPLPSTTGSAPVQVDVAAAAAFRQAAWTNGYRPLPVITREKRPAEKGWPGLARQTPPPCARTGAVADPGAASTGILADGLRIIDVDVNETQPDAAGIAAAIRLLAEFSFGPTPVRTRADSPRLLLVYRASTGKPGKLSVSGPFGAVEVLGAGQQFVADGIHPGGQPYRWEDSKSPATVPLADLPAVTEDGIRCFLDFCRTTLGARKEPPDRAGAGEGFPPPPSGRSTVAQPGPRERAYAATALGRNAADLAAAPSGQRNILLNALAFRMGRFVEAGWIERDRVEDTLIDAADQCGLTDDDGEAAVLRTLESGLAAGMKKPIASLLHDGTHPEIDAVLFDPETGEFTGTGQMLAGPAGSPEKAVSAGEQLPLYPDPHPQAPYPVERLGPVLREAVTAIASKIQVPVSLAAGSVLAVASLAAQAHVDVRLPFGQTRPASLYLLTVAGSGDRKSSADNEALRPVRGREETLRRENETAVRNWTFSHATWAAMKRKLEQKAGSTKGGGPPDYETLRTSLEKLGPEPAKPIDPVLTSGDLTIDGLTRNWGTLPGAIGLFTAEGGQFSGGHNMTSENKARSAAMLSELWDRGEVKRIRAGDGTMLLSGRRLSMHLMMQPQMATTFLADDLLQDQGLFSRVLIAAPASIAGTRLYRQPTREEEAGIARYEARILELLELPPATLAKANELVPRVLSLGERATELWQAFFDRTERATGPEGELASVRPLAAKAAEHAARIATVITMVETPEAAEIGPEAMTGGIALADWYTREAARLANAGQIDPGLRKAQELLNWIEKHGGDVLFRDILYKGPGALRSKEKAETALRILTAHGRVIRTSGRPRRVKVVGLRAVSVRSDSPETALDL